MTATTSRLNFRVGSQTEHRLRAAAAATDQSLTEFVISAAESRADEVLATHTAVPAEYFNELLAALDTPARPNADLRAAVRDRRTFQQA